MSRYYDIALTFCDEPNNRFIRLGGGSFRTKSEQRRRWAEIPAVSDSPFIADLIGPNRIDILGDKFVSAVTVERITGKSISDLIKASGGAR